MYRKSFPPKTLRRFIVTAVLLALAVSPWFYHVRQVNEISNATPVLIRPTSVDLFNTFSQFLFGFQNDHINTVLVSLWPLSVLFGFLSLRRRQNIPPEIVYFFLAAILPITFAFVVSTFVRPIFLSRYLILAAPSLYIFFTWVLSNYPKALSVSLRFALVAIMVVTLAQQTLAASTPVKEDYRDVSEYIASHSSAQDVVALSAPFTVYPFEYYYKGVAPVVTLPLWNRFQSGSIPVYSAEAFPSDVSAATANHDNVWLVLSYDQGFQRDVYLYFETHYERMLHIQFSPNLDLYKYKIRYDSNNPQIQNP